MSAVGGVSCAYECLGSSITCECVGRSIAHVNAWGELLRVSVGGDYCACEYALGELLRVQTRLIQPLVFRPSPVWPPMLVYMYCVVH